MKLSISKPQLIRSINNILFIACAVVGASDSAESKFITHRHQQREASLYKRISPNLQSHAVSSIGGGRILDNTQSTAWAGAVQVNPSGTFMQISADWTLPSVSPPPGSSGAGDWYMSTWVGIDGYECQDVILQAGTVSHVNVDSNGVITTDAYAWYEWYPELQVTIPNFPVAAGNVVEFSVTADTTTTGTIMVTNRNTNQVTTINVSAPDPGSALCGTSAEWIVEDFSNMMGQVPFAAFTDVSINDCMAQTTDQSSYNIQGATLLDLVDEISGTTLATAEMVSNNELKVSYVN